MTGTYAVVGKAVYIIANGNLLYLAALPFLASCFSTIVQVYGMYFE
jgi:hypothetical protein